MPTYTNVRTSGQANAQTRAKQAKKSVLANPAASAAAAGPKTISGSTALNSTESTFQPAASASNQGGSAFGSVGSDPWGGFAGRYKPTDFGTLYSNPSLIGNDILSSRGYNPQGALGGVLGDTAGAFSSLADFLQLAKGGGSPEGYVNTMADLLGQQMQVGGRDVDYRELLNLIMGATNTGNNPLYALLTQRPNDPTNTELTPEEQISMLTDVANLARLGMTPMTARAFSALLSSGARDWQSSLLGNAQGAAPTFVDYLRQSGLLQGLQ